jgi:two-component system heavy metal sensor histidine kinase CusS
VHADAHLLRRAVSNLVSNAIRYTTRGNTIVLRTVADQDGVHLSVSNTGPSIVAEDLRACSTVFTDRTNQDRHFASNRIRTGHRQVDHVLHHGSAQVQSEQDGVTTFTFFFQVPQRLYLAAIVAATNGQDFLLSGRLRRNRNFNEILKSLMGY